MKNASPTVYYTIRPESEKNKPFQANCRYLKGM